MRYEVRFYDAFERVKVTVELTACDRPAAEQAARYYLEDMAADRLGAFELQVGTVRELAE